MDIQPETPVEMLDQTHLITTPRSSEYVYRCEPDSLRKSEVDVAAKLYRFFLRNGKTISANIRLSGI